MDGLGDLPRLARFVRPLARRLAVPAVDVDNLAQAGLIAVWLHLRDRGPSDRTLLLKIAHRAMIDLLRHEGPVGRTGYRRLPTYDTDLAADRAPSAVDPGYAAVEARALVVPALAGLPPRTRDVLYRAAAGETLAAVAARHGVTEARAGQVRSAALVDLRQRLAFA